MAAKAILSLLITVVILTNILVEVALADAIIQERAATITKIVGNQVSVKTRDGREIITEVRSPARLKVGDQVNIRQVAPGQLKFIIDDNK